MGNQVCVIGRQHAAKVAEVMILAKLQSWWPRLLGDSHSKRRTVPVCPEEYDVAVWRQPANVVTAKQYRSQRLPGCQALVAPYRHEARSIAVDRSFEPVRIFPPMAVSIDECASENIVVPH